MTSEETNDICSASPSKLKQNLLSHLRRRTSNNVIIHN